MNGPDLEKPYQDSQAGEWSKAADAAFDTLANLKKAKADLMWISGNEKEKTSYGVNIRWERLQSLIAYIRQPVEKYCKTTLDGIEKELKSELDDMDRANVDFDDDEEGPTKFFGYYLEQYAEVIISALKKEMKSNDWGDCFEAEDFENNR